MGGPVRACGPAPPFIWPALPVGLPSQGPQPGLRGSFLPKADDPQCLNQSPVKLPATEAEVLTGLPALLPKAGAIFYWQVKKPDVSLGRNRKAREDVPLSGPRTR